MVARTRYRFPLPPPLGRKFAALDRRLDVRVLAAAATPADAAAAEGEAFELGILAGRTLARRKPTVVVEVHGDFRTATRLYGSRSRKLLAPATDLAARTALRRADRVRTVGPFTSEVVRKVGVEPDASFPAFTDVSTLAAQPTEPLPDEPSFLFVGVLERYKNVGCLVEAWRRVAR
jgi:hypothetical protein